MPAAAQQSLLDLLEQSIVVAKRAKETRTERSFGVASLNLERQAKQPNPFRKRIGPCAHHEHEQEERLFWCHLCGGIGCMEWLKKHNDPS